MTDSCFYEVRVIGSRKACLFVYESMPRFINNEIMFEDGDEDNHIIGFVGDYDHHIDVGFSDSLGKLDISSWSDKKIKSEAKKYFEYSMKAKSKAIGCDILVHYWSPTSNYDRFMGYTYGKLIKQIDTDYKGEVFDWEDLEFIDSSQNQMTDEELGDARNLFAQAIEGAARRGEFDGSDTIYLSSDDISKLLLKQQVINQMQDAILSGNYGGLGSEENEEDVDEPIDDGNSHNKEAGNEYVFDGYSFSFPDGFEVEEGAFGKDFVAIKYNDDSVADVEIYAGKPQIPVNCSGDYKKDKQNINNAVKIFESAFQFLVHPSIVKSYEVIDVSNGAIAGSMVSIDCEKGPGEDYSILPYEKTIYHFYPLVAIGTRPVQFHIMMADPDFSFKKAVSYAQELMGGLSLLNGKSGRASAASRVKGAKSVTSQVVAEEPDAENEVSFNDRFSYKLMQKASGKGYEIIIPDEFKLVKGDGQRDFTATTSVKGWTSSVFAQITFYSSMILPMSIEIPDTLAKLKKATYENIKQTLPMMEFVAKQMGATKKPVVNDISSDRMACAVISIKTRDCFYHYPQVVTSAGFRQFRVDMLTEDLGMSFEESIEYVKDLMSTVEVDLEFKDVVKNKSVPAKGKSASKGEDEEPTSILDPSVQSSLTFDKGETAALKGMVIAVPDGFKSSGNDKTFKLYLPGSNGVSNAPFVMVVDSVKTLKDCDNELAGRMALIDGEKAIMNSKKMIDGIIPCSRGSILYRIMATKHVFTVLFVVPKKLYTFDVTTKPKYGFSQAVADIRELLDRIVLKPDFAGIKPVDDESYLTKPDKNEIEAWGRDVSECQKLINDVKDQETKHLKEKNKASLLDDVIYKSETQRINEQYKSVMSIVNSGIVSAVGRASDWPAELLASLCRKAQSLICESKGVDCSGKEQIQLMLKNANAMIKVQKEAKAEAIRQERINSRVNPRLIEVEDHSVPVPKAARDQYKDAIESISRNKGVAKRKINSLLAEYPDYPEAIWLKMLLDLGINDDNGLSSKAESIFEEHVDLMFEAISKGSVSFALNKIKLLYSFAGKVNNSVCYDLVYRLISYDFNDRDQLLAKLIESSLEAESYDVIASVMIFLKLPEELDLFRILYDRCCDASRKDDGVKAIHELFAQYNLTGYEVLEEFNRFVEVMENGGALSDSGVDLSCYDENALSMLFRMLIDHILLCSDYDKNHYIDELAEYPGVTDEILQESSDRVVRNYMVVGKRLYDKKKYEDAYNIFMTVRTIAPENAQAGYYLCRLEKMNSKSVEYIWEAEGFDDCVAGSDEDLIEMIGKDVSKDKKMFEPVISKKLSDTRSELETTKKDLETAKTNLQKWEVFNPRSSSPLFLIIPIILAIGIVFMLVMAVCYNMLVIMGPIAILPTIVVIYLFYAYHEGVEESTRDKWKKHDGIALESRKVGELRPRVDELSQKLADVEAHEKKAKDAINKVINKRVELGLGEELTNEETKAKAKERAKKEKKVKEDLKLKPQVLEEMHCSWIDDIYEIADSLHISSYRVLEILDLLVKDRVVIRDGDEYYLKDNPQRRVSRYRAHSRSGTSYRSSRSSSSRSGLSIDYLNTDNDAAVEVAKILLLNELLNGDND